MSDHREIPDDHTRQDDAPQSRSSSQPRHERAAAGDDPLLIIDECLASLADDDPRQKLLYKLRHLLLKETVSVQQREAELVKLKGVVDKLTAPANRVGTLLELPGDGVARIAVGGAEYYTTIDPRVPTADLRIGTQVLVNEAYAVINALGYDRTGPVLKLAECLADGRLRFEQEPGRQALILQRSSELDGMELKAGDHLRIDPAHRIAIERLEDREASRHVLDEVPTVTWEQIGGQHQAIGAIRKAIEYPLLHAETFARYQFTQPKGFLLYGPPGCGLGNFGPLADHAWGVPPHQGARNSQYVARGIGAHDSGFVRASQGAAAGRRAPVHLSRRGGVHSGDAPCHAVFQHLQHSGAHVLFRA